jgi:vacuolar protein sorting-associated protein 45
VLIQVSFPTLVTLRPYTTREDLTYLTMDVLKACQTYLNKMITEVAGMKVLLLDAHTTPIVSMVMTQTELLAHEVYLTDRIDKYITTSKSHY